jgi:hypothetical protein
MKIKKILLLLLMLPALYKAGGQSAEELVQKIRAKLDMVNDYEAKAIMKTNVVFIKAPVAKIKVYYKKPDKLRIHNESGISFVPKGSVNINLSNIFVNTAGFDIIDAGRESGSGFRIIKLLPREEDAAVALSTLYIDEVQLLVRKAKTTTRENGTYELEMSYGKYAGYGLADKVVFTFNTRDYKLPKGVSFDYDDGRKKIKPPGDPGSNKEKNKKGKVEIAYSSYIINKGIPDSLFK